MPGPHGLFSMQEDERREFERGVKLFHFYSIILGIALAWFGIERILTGSGVLVGIIELVGAGSMAVLSATLFITKRLETSRLLLSVIAGVVIAIVFQEGGIGRSGPYWLFIFPHATMPFFRTRTVIVLNAFLYASTVGAASVGYFGLLSSPYDGAQLRQLGVALLLSMVIAFITQRSMVHQLRTIAEHRARLSVLLERLPAGVVMFESDGRKTAAANANMEKILGRPIDPTLALEDYPRTYALTTDTGQPYPVSDLPVTAALAGIEAPPKSGIVVVRPDGTKVILRAAAAPIRDGNEDVVAAVLVLEDMTKEYEIDRMKSEFVSLASHQLKTPLTTIRWSAENLLAGEKGPLTKDQTAAIAEIHAFAERLSGLVADILNVSHIETGRKFSLNPKPTDIVPVLRDAVQETSDAAAKKGIRIVVDRIPEQFMRMADTNKIKEVFLNLIGNAIKYTPVGGVVEVFIERIGDEDVVAVRDEGIGIPKEEQSRIFERFYRASNVESDIEGTGLGLYIAKAIIERHSGRIWFDSAEGNGTTFHVALPPAA